MANKREVYQISLTRPHGVGVTEMKNYIENAISSWSRGGDPDDPKWDIGFFPIKVKRVIESKEKKQ